ncbi:hypothetical protein [Pseudomonas sp. OF001]|uniref:hypothetical protein n=1 Tax=Pseudomonas sp. OF001 TaxID=2772300 RepID=UPI00191B4B53|nr:hypothetical protein [Pseudomonas sp. OF001]
MALILPLTACTVVEGDYGYDDYPRYGDYPRHGGYYPPPRDGRWRWDDDLRVYVSTGYPRTYYHDHTYYRWNDNHWSSGRQFNGPWRVIEHRHVPPRLGQRYHSQPRYDNRHYDNRHYDNRHYDNRRHDDRGDGQWERRDQGRYYGPGTPQREWRNPSEGEQRLRAWQQEQERERDWRRQRELQQQQRQWQQRLDVRQERQWPQQRIETRPQRQWQSQRPERQQEHQWQQRPQRQWQQREQHRQQQVGEQRSQRHERRMASPSSSSPDDAGGQRMGPARQRDGGRQWQERGESRGER